MEKDSYQLDVFTVFVICFVVFVICCLIGWGLGFIYTRYIRMKYELKDKPLVLSTQSIEKLSTLYSKTSKIQHRFIAILFIALTTILLFNGLFILISLVFNLEPSNISLIVIIIGLTALLTLIIFVCMYTYPINNFFNNLTKSYEDFMFAQYGPNGRLKHWSAATRLFRHKINWNELFTSKVYEVLESKILQTAPNSPIHIIGPTANYGECELALAEKVAKFHAPGVIMDASDVLTNAPHVPSFTSGNLVFNYQSSINVNNLNNHYKLQVDAIFDNKGALWHKLESDEPVTNTEQLLNIYHSLLKVGGIVIIDSYPNRGFKMFVSQIQLQLFNTISYWFAERSTFKKLKPVYDKSTIIQNMFDIAEIKDGLYSVTYLIKK